MDAAVSSCFANEEETEQRRSSHLQIFNSNGEQPYMCIYECGAHTHTHTHSICRGSPGRASGKNEKQIFDRRMTYFLCPEKRLFLPPSYLRPCSGDAARDNFKEEAEETKEPASRARGL